MRQLLNRHPSLAICGETFFHWLVYRRRKLFGDLGDPLNRRRAIDKYLASGPIRKIGIGTAELAEKLSREATSYQAMFTAVLRYYADSQHKPRFGEKTPRHALFLETLHTWFPGAVILHMVRDPRAAVASLQHVPWAQRSVVMNARRWLELNQAARRFRDQPGYLEVRYEALVTDPVGELNRICSFLGEEYSPAMLATEFGAAGDTGGPERWRTPITSARLEVWRSELTTSQVAQIEWALGPHLESFGYARYAPPASTLTAFRGRAYAALCLARTWMRRLPPEWYRLLKPTKIAKLEPWPGPKIRRKGA